MHANVQRCTVHYSSIEHSRSSWQIDAALHKDGPWRLQYRYTSTPYMLQLTVTAPNIVLAARQRVGIAVVSALYCIEGHSLTQALNSRYHSFSAPIEPMPEATAERRSYASRSMPTVNAEGCRVRSQVVAIEIRSIAGLCRLVPSDRARALGVCRRHAPICLTQKNPLRGLGPATAVSSSICARRPSL